jgi:hypothetical protein
MEDRNYDRFAGLLRSENCSPLNDLPMEVSSRAETIQERALNQLNLMSDDAC